MFLFYFPFMWGWGIEFYYSKMCNCLLFWQWYIHVFFCSSLGSHRSFPTRFWFHHWGMENVSVEVKRFTWQTPAFCVIFGIYCIIFPHWLQTFKKILYQCSHNQNQGLRVFPLLSSKSHNNVHKNQLNFFFIDQLFSSLLPQLFIFQMFLPKRVFNYCTHKLIHTLQPYILMGHVLSFNSP